MIFEKFMSISLRTWNAYLKQFSDPDVCIIGGEIFFPTIALFCEYGKFYSVELLGFSREYKPLIAKRRKSSDARSAFDLFYDRVSTEENSMILLDSSNTFYFGAAFVKNENGSDLNDRTPVRSFYKFFFYDQQVGTVISLGENFRSAGFEGSIFINRYEEIVRCKFANSLSIVAANISANELNEFYEKYYWQWGRVPTPICGASVYPTSGSARQRALAAQLQSIFLSKGIHETTIGAWLKENPDIIYIGFDTDHFIHEPTFDWQDHDGTVDGTAINPDIMFRRSDGFYDIIDLKLAMLDRNRLTKGTRARRRFVDSVSEGIAQLANYREYFEYAGNADFAWRKYGIKVMDPNLYLLVGSLENLNKSEVQQAMRSYRGNKITIIDWDSLSASLLRACEEMPD